MNVAPLYDWSQPGTYSIQMAQPQDGHLVYSDRPKIVVTVDGVVELAQILQSKRDQFWDRAKSTQVNGFVQTQARSQNTTVTRRRQVYGFALPSMLCSDLAWMQACLQLPHHLH